MDVLTLTLNPCVDRTMWVDDFNEEPHRIEYQSGGKGINVARVLSNLGAPVVSLFSCGGDTGEQLKQLVSDEGIKYCACTMTEPTRVVDTFVRAGDFAQRVNVGAPPSMTDEEIEQLEKHAREMIPQAKLFCVCGSACCEQAAQLGARLIEYANGLGVKTLLDSNGMALTLGITAKPNLIKPNQVELEQLLGHSVASGEEENAARTLIDSGIDYVLLSKGESGAMWVERDCTVYCPAPKIETVNAVGSGDSFVAGYIYAQLSGANEYKSLMIACAAGAANAAQFPAACVGKADIEKILGYGI